MWGPQAPESVIARLPPATPPPRSGGAFTQQVTFAAPNSALAKTLNKADRRTGGLLSSRPATLVNGGFDPVRQSTTEQVNLLQSSSDEVLRTQLRAAGFPEDAMEDQVAISGLVEDYVVPYEHEITRSNIGSSSAAIRLPSSQSTISPVITDTAVGMFIRHVQEANLKELKQHAPNDPDSIYRRIHKSNKRSFDSLMCFKVKKEKSVGAFSTQQLHTTMLSSTPTLEVPKTIWTLSTSSLLQQTKHAREQTSRKRSEQVLLQLTTEVFESSMH